MAIDMMTLLAAELNMHSLPDQRKPHLSTLLKVAEDRIRQHGITLNPEEPGDVHLQVEYAAWLYRRRMQEASKLMPQYLRLDLHDRLIAEKARVSNV